MSSFLDLFPKAGIVLAMIHLPALPGTPKCHSTPAQILAQALEEADIYQEAGVDGLILENMHDRPYLKGTVGSEVTACMAVVAAAVKERFKKPVGVQILAGANEQALSVAHAAGLDFIRAEGFVFAHVADEGLIEACAGPLLRFRRKISAENVAILCDIKKKHSSHSITADTDLSETARAAEFSLSDGLIITGSSTGHEAAKKDLEAARAAMNLPIFAGSGVRAETVANVLTTVHGVIVGSDFKVDGHWSKAIDPQRVRRFMNEVQKWRAQSNKVN